MAKSKSPEIVGKMVGMLTDLSSEERHRVIQASLTLLGDAPVKVAKNSELEEVTGDFSPRARTWMKQNSISSDQIQQVFHFTETGFDVIAPDIPGNGKKEKTLNAYILSGLATYLKSGESTFSDDLSPAISSKNG